MFGSFHSDLALSRVRSRGIRVIKLGRGMAKGNCAALAGAVLLLSTYTSVVGAAMHPGAWPTPQSRMLATADALPGPLVAKTTRTGAPRASTTSAPAAGASFMAIISSSQPMTAAGWPIANDSGEFYMTRGDAGLSNFGGDRPRGSSGWSRTQVPATQSTPPQRAAHNTATSESRTYAMLLAGLALMGFVARRRQKARHED